MSVKSLKNKKGLDPRLHGDDVMYVKGFTLIELLVSIGLFSVVLTIALSSILSIADANKKARSLMSVTNNLNFALDSITRSFKSGTISGNPVSQNGKCLTTQEIDYTQIDFAQRTVKYCLVETGGVGTITKNDVALTSPDVDVDFLQFKVDAYAAGTQPVANIMIEGTVKVSETVRSSFSLQTSVSQRLLNI
jgi:prepilin-type N-terminal cleavage/methylation domain-containing protein